MEVVVDYIIPMEIANTARNALTKTTALSGLNGLLLAKSLRVMVRAGVERSGMGTLLLSSLLTA